MGAAKPHPQYKRSWKNLLLNKRYQLRFTFFMVGLSMVLMAVLGVWVMKEANTATTVAMQSVRGEACPKVPEVVEVPYSNDEAPVPMNIEEPAPGSADAKPAAPAGEHPPAAKAEPPKVTAKPAINNGQVDVLAVKALWCVDAECKPEQAMPLHVKVKNCDAYVKRKLEDAAAVDALRTLRIPVVKCESGGEPYSVADAEPVHRATVQLEESSMTITPTLPTDFADRIVAHHTCEMRQAGSIDVLEHGRRRIVWVLVATGLLLMTGLAAYGIKMTHKVAGPLFKVSLYFAKMRDGRLDTVYNLRKGDQLVEFYEHFKHAHAGVVVMERADIERIRVALSAAEAAGLADHPSVKELRTLLARKEKSIE